MGERERTLALRLQDIQGARRTAQCREPGCTESGAGGKPVCLQHLGRMRYARRLELELAAREYELARVLQVGARAVDVRGTRALELLDLLETHVAHTAGALAIRMDVPTLALERYAEALQRAGLVVVDERGFLDLSPAERARREDEERRRAG